MSGTFIDGNTVLSIAEVAEVQPFDDGAVVLNIDTGQLYTCNHVAMKYLALLDGHKTIDTLAETVAEEYSIPVSEVRNDLIEISGEMVGESLLSVRR